MQPHNPSDSSGPGKLISCYNYQQDVDDPVKKQNLPANIASSVNGGGIIFEGVAGKAVQIAVMNDQLPVEVSKTFDIEAINVCYKAPTTLGIGGKLVKRLWKRDCDEAKCGMDNCSKNMIVKNVSFRAKAGEVLAIAGPSGAGKSTVLELLAGKIRPSSPADSILVNQQPIDVPTFRRISGYIPQSDALFPFLTVKETLLFSANLRLPSTISNAEKQERVNSLMMELRLMHVANTRIGNDDVRGVSGGERRRVSIGVDVIHDPAVLLLDEPTSGLDSASALNVVEMLHSMAKTRSKTIVLSIHQPSYRIIQQINSFLILANGSVVHHGSLQLLQCQLMAAGHKIPAQVNILEYVIEDIVSKSINSSAPLENSSSKTDYPDCFTKGSSMALHDQEQMEAGHGACIAAIQINGDPLVTYDQGHDVAEIADPTFANNNVREVIILSQRFARNVFRTYELLTSRILQSLLAGLSLGTLFIHVGINGRGVEERLGFFAFTLTFLLSSTVEALPIFLQERQVFIRETSRGAYRVSSYLLANCCVFLPFLFMVALLYALPVYWLTGLSSNPSAFCFFLLIVWLVFLTANSFVAFFGALVPDYIMGNSIISGFLGAFFLFSGYFISKQNMPPYWRFMHYISLFKYPLDALLINEYSSLRGKCFGLLLPGGGCTRTSDDVLRELGLQKTSKWSSVFIMIMFFCLYRILCYIVLRFKTSRRKR